MKINIYPFQVHLTLNDNKLNKDEFLNRLVTNQDIAYPVFEKNRVVAFKEIPNKDYIAGVLLSFRDYNAHCRVTRSQNGGYEATVEEIRDGAEYNFFILNKTTLKGVWLTYHNAAALSVLSAILTKHLVEYAKSEDIEIKLPFYKNNKIGTSFILSNETVDQALDKFNRICSVEFNERLVQRSRFSPDSIRYKKSKFIINKDSSMRQLKQDIKTLFESDDATETKVSGINKNNSRESINLDNIFRPWKTFDYDVITRTLTNFNTDNLLAHTVTQSLIEISTENRYKTILEE